VIGGGDWSANRLVPDLANDPASLDRLAEHIADFSIGGIRAMRKSQVASRKSHVAKRTS